MLIHKFRDNIYGMFVVLILLVNLVISAANINSAFYVSLIPNILFLFFYWYRGERISRVLRQVTKWDVILSVGCVLVFLLLLPLSSILSMTKPETGIGVKTRMALYVYMVILIFNLFGCFLIILSKDTERIRENATKCNVEERVVSSVFSNFGDYKRYFYLIAAASLLCILAAYPGQLKSDGYNVWRQIIGESAWSDWHDIGYVFFVWICTRIWENPFMAILGQTLIWIYVNAFILNYLNRYKGVLSCRIYTIGLFVVGTMFHYMKVLYKDTIFSIALVGFTITLLAYVHGEHSIKIIIQLIFFGILAASVRHMMIIPVVAGLLAGSIYELSQKQKKNCQRTLIILGLTVVLFCSVRYSVLQVSNAEENPGYVKYSMPLQMMAAYASTGEVDEISRGFMEQYLPIEQWADAYQRDNYMSDYIAREWYGIITADQLNSIAEHGTEIIKVNWRFLTQNPKGYLQAFFKQNSLVWRMSEIDGYPVMLGPAFDNEAYVGEYGENHPELFTDRNYLTQILEPFIVMMFSNPLWKSVVWHSGLSLIVMLVSIVFSVRKKKMGYVCALMPVIVVDIMLMLTLPAQDPRYILPTIQVGILYFAIYGEEFTIYRKEYGKGQII